MMGALTSFGIPRMFSRSRLNRLLPILTCVANVRQAGNDDIRQTQKVSLSDGIESHGNHVASLPRYDI